MSIGTVKWFNIRKGYGFIVPEEKIMDRTHNHKDVFVHITKVQELGLDALPEGARIYYEPYDVRGRVAAGNLRLL